jgi:hypothetical protein
LTIFCSSIKKARTILSRTQLLHREPPYARETVFCGRETVAYSRGRRAGICCYECEQHVSHGALRRKIGHTPGSLIPQSPHFGGDPRFLMCRYRRAPPGVLVMRTLFERVL